MFLYLEPSAALKLYANEEHRPFVRDLRDRVLRAGGTVAISSLGYVEMVAALAAMVRSGRMSYYAHGISVQRLRDGITGGLYEVLGTDPTVERVAAMIPAIDDPERRPGLDLHTGKQRHRSSRRWYPGVISEHPLRGYDCVHLAHAVLARERALEVAGGDVEGTGQVLMLTFDRDLHEAAVRERIAYENPHPSFDGGERFREPGFS